jgi:DNA-binding transcriptional regulator YhcF (GntR family)
MRSLDLTLNPRSPVPLYHQIAEAIRYRIATGALAAGAVLPPLRDAARAWGVNLHTVRRAYGELAEAGIVATRAPRGTEVLPSRGGEESSPRRGHRGRSGHERDAFLSRVIGEARERHGLSLPDLLASLERRRVDGTGGRAGTVRVAECSLSQSADLARQIGERWRVRAIPWPIQRAEPPAGEPVVASLFHYNDLRLSWPERFPDIHFLPIRPDSGLLKRLHARSPGGRRTTVTLFEREESMLRNVASDLSRILPAGEFRVLPKVTRRPARVLEEAGPRGIVLVPPRIWGDLPASLREHPRVHEVRYVFDPTDLESLGRDLGWVPRHQEA